MPARRPYPPPQPSVCFRSAAGSQLTNARCDSRHAGPAVRMGHIPPASRHARDRRVSSGAAAQAAATITSDRLTTTAFIGMLFHDGKPALVGRWALYIVFRYATVDVFSVQAPLAPGTLRSSSRTAAWRTSRAAAGRRSSRCARAGDLGAWCDRMQLADALVLQQVLITATATTSLGKSSWPPPSETRTPATSGEHVGHHEPLRAPVRLHLSPLPFRPWAPLLFEQPLPPSDTPSSTARGHARQLGAFLAAPPLSGDPRSTLSTSEHLWARGAAKHSRQQAADYSRAIFF